MANNSMNFNVNFNSQFDSSQVLKGLEEVRKKMGALSADEQIFKGVDKEFVKLKSLLSTLDAQSKNVGNAAGLNAYQRTLERVRESANRISQEMGSIAKNETQAFNFKDVADAQKKIQQLNSQLETANKDLTTTSNKVKESFKGMGITPDDAAMSSYVNQLAQGKSLMNIITQDIIRQTTEVEKIRQKYEELNKASRNVKISANDEIANKGQYKTKTQAEAATTQTIKNTIGTDFAIGVKNAEDVLVHIQSLLNAQGIKLNENSKVWDNIRNTYTQLVSKQETLNSQFEPMKANMNQISNTISNLASKGVGGTADGFKELQNQLIHDSNAVNDLNNKLNTANNEINNINNQDELDKLGNEAAAAAAKTETLVDAQEDSVAAQREANQQQQTLNQAFDRMGNAVKNVLSIGNAWRQVNRYIRQTFQDVQRLDQAFASIAMVTDYQVSDLWGQYDQYSELANKLGQTTEGAIKSSALFYQQGLDTAEALSLTEDTLKMATLAGEDYTTATTQMTAALRGFHMEMEEGSRVTDVYSELAANAAASVQGIAYAMSKTASIANNAGMSFETTAAFITNMIETTQEAPENIGTAMKTIIARFTELKENVDESGEDLESMDFNKVDKALKSVGVQLKDTTGSFRNLDDVFLELSSKWDTLTRNQQRYIATIAAGSRQQSRFIAMMEDYERTLELVETAQDSAGRSDEQFAKYADTVTFKLNQLKNSWEELRVSFLGSDDYKKGLDFANSFLNSIKNIDPKVLIADVAIFGIIGKNIISNIIKALREGTNDVTKAYADMSKRIGTNAIIDKIYQKQYQKIGRESREQLEKELNKLSIKFDRNKLTITSTEDLLRLGEISGLEETIYHNTEKITNMTRSQLKAAYEEINQKLVEQGNKHDAVIQDLIENKNYSKELATLMVEQAQNLKSIQNEEQSITTKITNENIIEGEINNQLKTRLQLLAQQDAQRKNNLKTLKDVAGNQIATGLANSIAYSLTTGITTAISTGDTKAALDAAGTTFAFSISSTITQLLSMGLTKLLGSITLEALSAALPVIIPVAAVLAVAGIVKAVKYAYSAEKKIKDLEKEAEELNKELDKVSEKMSDDKGENDEFKNQKKSLEDLKKAYEDYSKKITHTQEEQQQYQEILSNHAEDFPDLISLQNDEYVLQNSLLEKQIGLIDEKLKKSNLQYAQDKMEANNLEEELARNSRNSESTKNQGTKDNLKDVFSNLRYDADYKGGYRDDSFGFKSKSDMKKISELNKETNDIIEDFYNEKNNTNIDFNKIEELSKEERDKIGRFFYNLNEDDLNKMIAEATEEVNKKDTEQFNSYVEQIEQADANKEQIIKDHLKADDFSDVLSEYLFGTIENIEEFVDDYEDKIGELENKGERLKEVSDNFSKIGDLSKEEMDALYNGDYDKITSKEGKEAVKIFKSVPEEGEEIDYLKSDLTNNRQQDWEDEVNSLKEITSNAEKIWDLSKLTAKEIEAIKIQYNSFLERVPEDIRSSIDSIQLYLQSSSGLSKDDYQKAWGQVNWADLGIENLETERKKFIDAFKESGATEEQGAQAWEEALSAYQNAGVISLDFNNPEEAQDWLDKQKEELEKTFDEDVSVQLALKPSGEKLSVDELEEWQKYADEIGEDIETFVDLDTMTITVDAETYEEKKKEAFETINRSISSQQTQLEALAKDTKLGTELESVESILEKYDEIKQKKEDGIALNEDELEFYDELTPKMETINSLEKTRNGMITAALVQKKKELDAITEARKDEYETLKGLRDAQDKLNQAVKDQTEKVQEAQKKIDDQVKKNAENEQKALKEINDALKDVAEQENTILEKEQAIVDKTQKLNDALYGTDNYLSKRNSLQNYSDRLDQLSSAAEKAKKALDNPEIGDNVAELVKNYGEAIHQEMVYQQALNQRKEDQKNQILGYLQGFGSEYFTIVDGFLQANYSAIDNAQMNDQLKDQIYQYLDDYNKVQKEIIDGEDKYNDLLKDMKERRKSALSDMVNLQKDTAEILKESYEKEIEDVKEKYDAIKKADDEYLDALQDAIDKQRKLREEENKWNDLATKEKKLSLISRDTSGSQQKETLKLQEEIENDRQSLLDNSVDNILDTLKETYEEQQKEREEELEYQEQMIEDMDFMKQAMEIIQSMDGSSENYLAWLTENDPEYLEGSPLEQELYLEEHANDLAPFEEYAAITNSNFQNYLNITADEVNQVMAQTSDNMNEYLERSHQNTLDKVQEEQDAAQEALNQAYEDLDEAKLKLEELHEKVTEAYENYDQTLADGEQDLQEAYENYDQVLKDVRDNVRDTQIAYNEAMEAVHKLGITDVSDMDKKVEDSYNKYIAAQGSAEQALLTYKQNLFSYGTAVADVLDAISGEASADTIRQISADYTNAESIAGELNSRLQNAEINLTWAAQNNLMDEAAHAASELNSARNSTASDASNFNNSSSYVELVNENGRFIPKVKNKYATGGLVDYTGPAWVDGSPTRPEAFLSAEDTARIGAAAQLLSNLPFLNTSSITDNSYSSNVGDTTIEVHINIENVSSEQDIDDMINRVRDDIVSMSNQIGNPVLLNK